MSSSSAVHRQYTEEWLDLAGLWCACARRQYCTLLLTSTPGAWPWGRGYYYSTTACLVAKGDISGANQVTKLCTAVVRVRYPPLYWFNTPSMLPLASLAVDV